MQQINEYKIIKKIATGGMSVVYLGQQVSLKRPVAIKILSKDLTKDQSSIDRFNQEALIIAKLSHPNIIQIIDRGINDEMYYFVMNFVDGRELKDIIEDKLPDYKTGLDIIINVCKALSYAHKNGVIHRDIKPSNIMVDNEDNVYVTDFGIAQLFSGDDSSDQITRPGSIIGTIAYMSPEQKTGNSNITFSTDIYSLGLVMYELFTGKQPQGLFKKPSELNISLPKIMDEIITKCLDEDPKNRFVSADKLKDALLGVMQGGHIKIAQKEKAFLGMSALEDKYNLLDIMKDDEYGAVYLFEKINNKERMVIKKVAGEKDGFLEAKFFSENKHRNIVNIHGASQAADLFIVVMEYIRGGTLKDRLIKPFELDTALKVLVKVFSALRFAHKNGIYHGNLRPSNILITETSDIKLTDFGLNEHYHLSDSEENWYSHSNEPKSAREDIYSMGVVFYKMIIGDISDIREDKFMQNEKFKSLPNGVQVMIDKMLSIDNDKRYRKVEQVLFDIKSILLDKVVEENKRSNVLKYLIFLLVLLVFIVVYDKVYDNNFLKDIFQVFLNFKK